MNRLFLGFVKVTGLPVQYFYYKKKIFYEDKKSQSRKIKGGALIVSNHTSIYDFPLIMFTFPKRVIRTLIAEVVFEKNKFMSRFTTAIGGIRVDRETYDFSFLSVMKKYLNKGQVGLVFPEARLPKKEEKEKGDLLEFKPSFVYLALETGVPIIPVYTNGIYGSKKTKNNSAKIIIGKKIFAEELCDNSKTEKENIDFISGYVKNYIVSLGKQLEKTTSDKAEK